MGIIRRCPASLSVASDEELVLAAAQEDHGAFRELVERYQGKAYAIALSRLRHPDDAWDVCQEAFLRAYRGLGNFQGESRFFTWLYRIVVNLCLDHLRARREETVEFDEVRLGESDEGAFSLPHPLDFDPARSLDCKELGRSIAQALAQLSSPHRTVLTLRELGGLSYAEIAQELGWEMGTVMSRLFHARKRMQAMLTQGGAVHGLAA